MMTQRETWKNERHIYENKKKEEEEQRKISLQRAEEEYKYQLNLQRKKDKDAYEIKRASLENELIEKRREVEQDLLMRTTAIAEQEEEIKELRKAKQSSGEILQQTIEKTKKEQAALLEKNYKYEVSLRGKETIGKIALLEQQIHSLKEKIEEKQRLMEGMSKHLEAAQRQTQDLAKKIVEGMSSSSHLKPLGMQEKAVELV